MSAATSADVEAEFGDALRAAGFRLRARPVMDGKWHRAPVEGDKGRSMSGRYKGYLEGILPAGFIEHFKDPTWTGPWKSGAAMRPLSAAKRADLAREAAAAEAERDRCKAARQATIARRCAAVWEAAPPAPDDHPYLARKGISAAGLRVEAGRLLVPMCDFGGRICGVQSIAGDGSKRFPTGGRVTELHLLLGEVAPGGVLLIAEGFATAATLHRATDHAVAVAFSKGNFVAVARHYGERFPGLRVAYCGDNDHHLPRRDPPRPNVGRVAAEAAARECGGTVLLPEFQPHEHGSDWNDYAATHGLDATCAAIGDLLATATHADPLQPEQPTMSDALHHADRIGEAPHGIGPPNGYDPAAHHTPDDDPEGDAQPRTAPPNGHGPHAANGAATEPPEPEPKPRAAKPEVDPSDLDGVDPTEDGVAIAFAARFQDQLRYCHHTGAWFQWTGTRWKREETKLAFSWARNICREVARTLADGVAPGLARASTAAAVERFGQADRVFAVTSETWDRAPWLLATPAGTVDLRDGTMRAAQQADYITRSTAVAPGASADCPRWLRFMAEVTNNDTALIRFLHQWCGYSLTALTREHALLFVHGPGGNGKTVFLNAVAGILGDYHATAAMDTFVASHGDKHPTDMAMLRGARMVTASETEEGRAWAESRIKQMTGGDPISARFMRQDFFTYTPQFKLTVVGNHKPALKNIDDAARRRFNIVPFLHKPAKPDRTLEDTLRTEWPGILAWMIEGCLDWQSNGLVRPDVVKIATDEYFSEQDAMGQWMAERCILDPSLAERPAILLADLNTWLATNGEQHTNRNRFRGWAERQPGLKYKTLNGYPHVAGVGLKAERGRTREPGE